jgi:hypothetical protein
MSDEINIDSVKKKMVNKIRISNAVMASSIFFLILFSIVKAPIVGIIFLIAGIVFKVISGNKLKAQVKSNPELAPVLRDARMIASQNKKNSIRGIYKVGLDSYRLAGPYLFSAREDGLHLLQGSKEVVIKWTDLVEVEAGSEGELRKRVTASRVMLTGVFALALKKEKLKDFYVSVATKDSIGLFEITANGKKNKDLEKQTRLLTAACNSKIRAANPKSTETTSVDKNNFEDIEKLGELLSKGLITQSEFELKKKEILGL